MCQRFNARPGNNNKLLLNLDSGQVGELNCKAWICPECGQRKAHALYYGALKFFASNKGIRMLTLTATNRQHDVIEHARILSKAFTIFLKEIRRSKIFTDNEKGVRYMKVVECHKSGYIHFHVLIDRFLNVNLIRPLWNRALQLCGFAFDGRSLGAVNICLIPSAKAAAKYVVKYVLKAVKDVQNLINKWSKSGNTPIYTHFEKGSSWILLNVNDRGTVGLLNLLHISEKFQDSNDSRANELINLYNSMVFS